MRRTSLALGLALLGGTAGCAHDGARAREGLEVEAEGWTPLDPRKPLETRLRAMAEAQKKAVEKALGVTVSATTKVESAVTLEQKILANIGGYIRRYDILSEREEGGFLKIRIRALVLQQPPAPLASAAGGVRIAVLRIDEKLARTVRSALSAQGFALTDEASSADYVITGDVSVYPITVSAAAGLRTRRARVSLDVTRTKTRETFRNTQEASGLDPVEEIAHDKAMDIAARMAGEGVAAHLKASLGIPAPGKP
ncbi:MAG: hypothetical protein HY403_10150 [Elusimicrobia bacterium]|nr:hypothetical protein [Elusimicrobiota bacterium]